MKLVPYGRQEINQADIDAVTAVLQSDYLTQGPAVPAFENAVAAYCGASHAIAVNSATSALHIAGLALGVGQGDIVWTSPITFVASSNSALYCGATVDFVDIDPRTYNLSLQRLAEKLALARQTGRLPKVVIPVHLCGQACDMAGIYALSKQYGFRIIEDASHAIGGKYQNEQIGNCRFSDITVFSFHPVKIITTGEGGLAVTQDPKLAKTMRMLRSHGISSAPEDMRARPAHEIWNYQQIGLGFNYRMTDIQAALGLSQMTRLNSYIAQRHQLAARYDEAFVDLPLTRPWQHPDSFSSYHLYPIRIPQSDKGKTQRQIYDALMADGFNVNVHYIPVYRQPYYESMGFKSGYCPAAESYYTETISLPIFPSLATTDQDRVIATLTKVMV